MYRNKIVFNRLSQLGPKSAFFALLLIFSSAANADSQQAMDWIQKLSMAMQELSYKGRFVYLHSNQLESMSILHVKNAQGVRERLVSLNGEAREILRDNNNLTCVWPSSRQVVVDQSNKSRASPIWVPDDVSRLSKFYEFSLMGTDRVADHPAVIVSIKPKDEYRYGMKMWIDESNGLLLKSLLLDEQDVVQEQILFTELDLMDSDDPSLFSVIPEIDSSYALVRAHSGDGNQRLLADVKWQLQAMPGGFWIESSFRNKISESKDYIQHIIVTDGMASVSVFIEPTSEQSLQGETSMGAVNAYGARWSDYSVIAIGEVPAKTVRQLAESTVYLD